MVVLGLGAAVLNVGFILITYGSGFLMSAYFPYFFYRAFNLKALSFQALYGVWIFLLLPYLVFFVLIYWINGELNFAVNYGSRYPAGKMEMMSMYFAAYINHLDLKNYDQ